jgi:hypothetical protein
MTTNRLSAVITVISIAAAVALAVLAVALR